MQHDDLCPLAPVHGTADDRCQCALIAKVRADERADADRRVDRIILRGANLHHKALADLRAKVERLDRWPVGGRRLVIHREEVLALIDEAVQP